MKRPRLSTVLVWVVCVLVCPSYKKNFTIGGCYEKSRVIYSICMSGVCRKSRLGKELYDWCVLWKVWGDTVLVWAVCVVSSPGYEKNFTVGLCCVKSRVKKRTLRVIRFMKSPRLSTMLVWVMCVLSPGYEKNFMIGVCKEKSQVIYSTCMSGVCCVKSHELWNERNNRCMLWKVPSYL